MCLSKDLVLIITFVENVLTVFDVTLGNAVFLRQLKHYCLLLCFITKLLI